MVQTEVAQRASLATDSGTKPTSVPTFSCMQPTITVPPGVRVRFEPDLELTLAPGASLHLPGGRMSAPPAGVRIAGTPEDPEGLFEGEMRLESTLVLPEGLRADLVTRTQTRLDAHPLPGTETPRLRPGTIGPDARVLGAASLPLSHRFLVDRTVYPGG